LAEVVGAALRLVQGSHIKRSRHSFHFISFRSPSPNLFDRKSIGRRTS